MTLFGLLGWKPSGSARLQLSPRWLGLVRMFLRTILSFQNDMNAGATDIAERKMEMYTDVSVAPGGRLSHGSVAGFPFTLLRSSGWFCPRWLELVVWGLGLVSLLPSARTRGSNPNPNHESNKPI